MYGSAASTRLSRGRSTPAMRAIRIPLSLLLFVLRVLANHEHPPPALDDLALLTHPSYRRTYFHDAWLLSISLTVTVGDAAPGGVVWRQFNLHTVPRQDPDEVDAHLS